jgi:hypothetical protein
MMGIIEEVKTGVKAKNEEGWAQQPILFSLN